MASAIRKKQKASRHQSENRPWGYQPSTFSMRSARKIERDIKAGFLPASMAAVNLIFRGRQPKKNKDLPPSRAGTGLAGKLLSGLKSIVGGGE